MADERIHRLGDSSAPSVEVGDGGLGFQVQIVPGDLVNLAIRAGEGACVGGLGNPSRPKGWSAEEVSDARVDEGASAVIHCSNHRYATESMVDDRLAGLIWGAKVITTQAHEFPGLCIDGIFLG